MTTSADVFFTDGCGRCARGGTPQCKVHTWEQPLKALRSLILECGLTEESKWGVPCYTYQGHNILMLGAFNDSCVLSFLKGALLQDTKGVLTKPGESTQSGRVIRFTHVNEVHDLATDIKAYIFEAIEVEKAGLKVEFKKQLEPIPSELQSKMDEIPAFRAAFEALTPGKQRGYILHISQAKQSETRASRVVNCMPKIMLGKSMQDK
jgi:uncharacterized protein YdeI (YjbR/CyaY-like superfamily)